MLKRVIPSAYFRRYGDELVNGTYGMKKDNLRRIIYRTRGNFLTLFFGGDLWLSLYGIIINRMPAYPRYPEKLLVIHLYRYWR
jgi:hypothetical protein